MQLSMTVQRCPEGVTPETRTLSGGEFHVGRGPDVDWTLPDPGRLLSKRHFAVALRRGEWLVADTSTNGTFLNTESSSIGRGAIRSLRDGDRLRLGSYEIGIRLLEDQPMTGQGDIMADPDARSRVGEGAAGAPSPNGSARPAQLAARAYGTGTGTEANATPPPPPFNRPPDRVADAGEAAARRDMPAADRMEAAPEVHQRAPYPPGRMPPHEVGVRIAPDPQPGESAARSRSHEDRIGSATPPTPGEAALLAAFFRGALLPAPHPEDPATMMNTLGQVMRALVAGLRAALIRRTAAKGEYRIEQTMMRAHSNNPLKFAASDDDALAALLGVGRRTEVAPAAAVEEALKDLRVHGEATLSAMREAARALLDELDPEKIRSNADQGGMTMLPAQRKARAWDAYETRHAAVSRTLVDGFDSVFGKAFARAYENAIGEISARERR